MSPRVESPTARLSLAVLMLAAKRSTRARDWPTTTTSAEATGSSDGVSIRWPAAIRCWLAKSSDCALAIASEPWV